MPYLPSTVSLFHRAKDVCYIRQLEEEHTHIQKVLTSCKYPGWALNRMKNKTSAPVKPTNNNSNNKKGTRSKTINRRIYITVPYMKSLSESIKKHLQEIWHTSLLQRGQDYQRSTGGTQRQGTYNQKEWQHL